MTEIDGVEAKHLQKSSLSPSGASISDLFLEISIESLSQVLAGKHALVHYVPHTLQSLPYY
jgi:hypothetical protein